MCRTANMRARESVASVAMPSGQAALDTLLRLLGFAISHERKKRTPPEGGVLRYYTI